MGYQGTVARLSGLEWNESWAGQGENELKLGSLQWRQIWALTPLIPQDIGWNRADYPTFSTYIPRFLHSS